MKPVHCGISFAVFICLSTNTWLYKLHAQHVLAGIPSQEVTYFTHDFQPLKSPEGAAYYRTIKKIENKYLVEDYYISNDKIHSGIECSEVNPEIIRDGKAVWYYENGGVKMEGNYGNGSRTGLWKTYYEDGKPREEMYHRGEETLYAQFWSRNGNPQLDHGTGFAEEVDLESQDRLLREFRDSLVVGAYAIRKASADTVYQIVEQTAMYRGGMEALYQQVGRSLKGKYPADARRMGIEGRIFIQFIVDKAGQVREPKVLRGIGAGCDELALQAISALTAWDPAIHDNRPVKQMFVLPVVFRLN